MQHLNQQLFVPGQPLVHAAEALVNAVEALVDSVEPLVDSVEPLVDSVEPLVDSVEPLVDSAEPLVDSVEPLDHFCAEFVEAEDCEVAMIGKRRRDVVEVAVNGLAWPLLRVNAGRSHLCHGWGLRTPLYHRRPRVTCPVVHQSPGGVNSSAVL